MLNVRPQFYDLADAKVDKLMDCSEVLSELDSVLCADSFNRNSIIYLYRVLRNMSQESDYYATWFHRAPLSWRGTVTYEDMNQFNRYQRRLNQFDYDLMCCLNYLDQLRFDTVTDYPELIRDRLLRCKNLLSGTGKRDGLYYLSLFDMVYKWILLHLIRTNPSDYKIISLGKFAIRFHYYKTEWHSIFCFRDFLEKSIEAESYVKILQDGLDYFIEHSGFYDPIFTVGCAVARCADYSRPYLVLPDCECRWNLSGKIMEDFFDRICRQPGFNLSKDYILNTLSDLPDVSFNLKSDYKFPIVTHVNWR